MDRKPKPSFEINQVVKRQILVSWPLFTLLLAFSLLGIVSLATWTVSFGDQAAKFFEINQLQSELVSSKKKNQGLRSFLAQLDEKVSSLELLAQEVTDLKRIKENNSSPFETPVKQLLTSKNHYVFFPVQGQVFETMKGELDERINYLGKLYTDGYLKLTYTPSIWPVNGILNDQFGNIKGRFEIGKPSFHQGIDISTRIGNPVKATAKGIVLSAKYHPTYGKRVILQHQFGISTVYAHLSNYQVKTGSAVYRGQVIGFVGNTGRSTGPHLHYEVRIGNIAVNPMRYISKYASNLLPKLGS